MLRISRSSAPGVWPLRTASPLSRWQAPAEVHCKLLRTGPDSFMGIAVIRSKKTGESLEIYDRRLWISKLIEWDA